jgi:hypothetical protein
LINIGIYHRGAEVAEVGTTWLESLAAMGTLRPFSSAEIAKLGGESAFIPATWSGLSFGDNEQILGIPIDLPPKNWFTRTLSESNYGGPKTRWRSKSKLARPYI